MDVLGDGGGQESAFSCLYHWRQLSCRLEGQWGNLFDSGYCVLSDLFQPSFPNLGARPLGREVTSLQGVLRLLRGTAVAWEGPCLEWLVMKLHLLAASLHLPFLLNWSLVWKEILTSLLTMPSWPWGSQDRESSVSLFFHQWPRKWYYMEWIRWE